MAIIETEAIVLSTLKQGDSSKIVRLFTRNHGKISIIAKGVRSKKSKISAVLEPLNAIKVAYYYKENRDLHMHSDCDIIEQFPEIRQDLDRLSIGLSVLEHVKELVVEEETNIELFEFLRYVLKLLTFDGKNVFNLHWYFQINFLRISGYGLELENCRFCENSIFEGGALFSIQSGGVMCKRCADDDGCRKLSAESLQVLRKFNKKYTGTIMNINTSPASFNEINEILTSYCRYHFEGYKTPESLKLLI